MDLKTAPLADLRTLDFRRPSADFWSDGLDAWNARQVAAARHLSPAEALRRFDRGHLRLRAAAEAMPGADLASPEAGDWTYECMRGHVRSHLAMVGPWCARARWRSRKDSTGSSA
jgi:hypothetical protein